MLLFETFSFDVFIVVVVVDVGVIDVVFFIASR